jgi:hypothetical protein
MASGNNAYHTSFVGVAAEVTIGTCPFEPRSITFYGPSGIWGYKTEDMSGDAYVSNTDTDAGVTITSTGCTIASGADVNSATDTIYVVMTP